MPIPGGKGRGTERVGHSGWTIARRRRGLRAADDEDGTNATAGASVRRVAQKVERGAGAKLPAGGWALAEERRLAMRVAGALWCVGGATILLVGLALYWQPEVHRLALAAGSACLAWGVLCLFTLQGERVREWVWHVPGLTALALTGYVGLVVGPRSPFRFYALFILLYIAYFFPWRQARFYFPIALVVYLAPLAAEHFGWFASLRVVGTGGAEERELVGEAAVLLPLFCAWALMAARARDVARSWRERERLRALTDYLTGLGNRRAMLARLERELAHANEWRGTGLIVIDLDSFKQFNTKFGYLVGDRVIREAAARLRAVIREHDLLVRLGGDEFAIVVSRADPPLVERIARRAVAAVPTRARDLGISEAAEMALGASAGGAIAPQDGRSPEELIAAADARLRAAKAAGKGTAIGPLSGSG